MLDSVSRAKRVLFGCQPKLSLHLAALDGLAFPDARSYAKTFLAEFLIRFNVPGIRYSMRFAFEPEQVGG